MHKSDNYEGLYVNREILVHQLKEGKQKRAVYKCAIKRKEEKEGERERRKTIDKVRLCH